MLVHYTLQKLARKKDTFCCLLAASHAQFTWNSHNRWIRKTFFLPSSASGQEEELLSLLRSLLGQWHIVCGRIESNPTHKMGIHHTTRPLAWSHMGTLGSLHQSPAEEGCWRSKIEGGGVESRPHQD